MTTPTRDERIAEQAVGIIARHLSSAVNPTEAAKRRAWRLLDALSLDNLRIVEDGDMGNPISGWQDIKIVQQPDSVTDCDEADLRQTLKMARDLLRHDDLRYPNQTELEAVACLCDAALAKADQPQPINMTIAAGCGLTIRPGVAGTLEIDHQADSVTVPAGVLQQIIEALILNATPGDYEGKPPADMQLAFTRKALDAARAAGGGS